MGRGKAYIGSLHLPSLSKVKLKLRGSEILFTVPDHSLPLQRNMHQRHIRALTEGYSNQIAQVII